MKFRWSSLRLVPLAILLWGIPVKVYASATLQSASTKQASSEVILNVDDSLTEGDSRLNDESLYDLYTFEGRAGQIIRVTLTSRDFDTFLLLQNVTGEELARNDDGSDGTDSEIVFRLLTTGQYRILANSFDAGGRGQYRLTVFVDNEQTLRQAEQEALADNLLQQGTEAFRLSQYRTALETWQTAIELYREVGDRRGEARTLGNLGIAYQSLGEYQQAIDFQQQALVISREVGDRHGETYSLGNLGLAYQNTGEYERSIDFQLQSLDIAREVGDRRGEASSLSALGNAYSMIGEYQRSIEFHEEALSIAREIGNRQGEANLLNNLGSTYYAFGNYQQAISLYEKALPITREIGDRQGELTSIGNLGLIYNSVGDYRRAINFHEEALSIAREIGDRQGESYALGNLGNAYASIGDYQQAIEFQQKQLTVAREISDSRGEINALDGLGISYESIGSSRQSIRFMESALIAAQEVGDRRRESYVINNLANIYKNIRDYQEAIELYQRSLSISIEIGDRAGEASSLSNLGETLNRMSEYDRAVEVSQKSVEINRELNDQRAEANALSVLGTAYNGLNYYWKAIEAHDRELVLSTRIGDDRGRAIALGNLGETYFSLGDYLQAIDFHTLHLTLAVELGDKEQESRSSGNLGISYSRLKKYDESITFLTRQLNIAKETHNKKEESVALRRLGIVHEQLKDYETAMNFLNQSLVISRSIRDRNGEAVSLVSIGRIHSFQERPEEALANLQQGLTLKREIRDKAGEARVLSDLGAFFEGQGEPILAIVFLKQAINSYEIIRDDNHDLSRSLHESFTASIEEDYRRLADLLLQQNRVLEAQRVLDLLKVQELDDYLRGVRGSDDSRQGISLYPQEEELSSSYDALANQAVELGRLLYELERLETLSPSDVKRMAELRAQQQAIYQEFNSFIESDDVRTLTEELSVAEYRQNIDLGQLNALQDNLRALNQNAVLLYPLILEDRIELILVSAYAPPIHRPVNIGREELLNKIVEFRYALDSPKRDAVTPAQQLYDWLIEPIEEDLASADAETIIYAPDGPLRYIPLAALHDGNRWLVERLGINHITADSLTDLNTEPANNPSILAGAFVTGEHTISTGAGELSFGGLPDAGTEMHNLSQLTSNIQQYMDSDFTREIIEQEANRHEILHLATHAKLLIGQPDESFILFGNGDIVTLAEMKQGWLNLDRVDLAVLSACETGIGSEIGDGGEILGFGYLMQSAGARASVASLWQVDDGGTQILMSAFYEALIRGGLSKVKALQQAQREVIDLSSNRRGGLEIVLRDGETPEQARERFSHPYYWASFILIGNGL